MKEAAEETAVLWWMWRKGFPMRNSILSAMVRNGILGLTLLLPASVVVGQTEPVVGLHGNTPRTSALIHARIVTGPGAVLEGATLLVREDCIEEVGVHVDVPADAVVRDLSGKTIYPGFIDLHTDYGMPAGAEEAKAGGATHWNPCVQAQRRASTLLGQDPTAAEDLRKAGFGAVVTFPKGGIFRGAGALVLLDRMRPNRMILAEDVAQAMSLWYRNGRQYPDSLMGAVALIRQTLLDTQWYEEAWTKFRQVSAGQAAPETNLALAALCPCVRRDKPVIMQVSDELDILRVAKIAQEFGLNMWVLGSGYEYRRLQAVKETGLRLIVPVNFPKAPDVSCLEQELRVDLRELRHWDFAPENPGRLAKSGVDFVLTTAGLKSKSEFLTKLRLAVQRGLPEETALATLTTRPAQWLGLSPVLGSLQKGKLANFVITDGDLFASKTQILETWVAGDRFVVTSEPDIAVRGQWTFVAEIGEKRVDATLKISGTESKPSIALSLQGKEIKTQRVTRQDRVLTMSCPGAAFGCGGTVRMTGIIEGKTIKGHGLLDDARGFSWHAEITAPPKGEAEAEESSGLIPMAEFPLVYPEGAFGRTAPPERPEVLLVKDATVWTCGPQGILSPGDVLVKGAKVAQVGRNLTAPEGTVVVNAAGKHVTPGLIDAHSHLAISGGVNESTHAVTSEVRIADVVNSDDINIYRQLAGGLTTACIIHGSANPIGGTYAVIKLKWGALPEELILRDAKPGLKLALGENVKRSDERYPDTRMGTVEIIRDAFLAAKAVKYGNVPPEEALKFVTWNAARHLCLESRLGSLEPGKEADFVVWSQSPLSTYSICEQTWIEGRKYFDLEVDRQLREQVAAQRAKLVQKILNENNKAKKDQDSASEKQL